MSTLLSFPRRLKPCLAAAFALSCWFSLSAQAAEPIKVGLVAALSGQSAKSGEALTRGLTIAIDEVNAQGGVNGQRIELVSLDDRNDRKQAGATLSGARRSITTKSLPAPCILVKRSGETVPDIRDDSGANGCRAGSRRSGGGLPLPQVLGQSGGGSDPAFQGAQCVFAADRAEDDEGRSFERGLGAGDALGCVGR